MERPDQRSIYSTLGRLTFNSLIHKLTFITDCYPSLAKDQQLAAIKFIQSDLNFLLWIIGTPALIDEVKLLEKENIHLRYSLYYNAGSA